MSEAIEHFRQAVVNVGFEPLKPLANSLEAAILDLDARLSALEPEESEEEPSQQEEHHE